ncbi:MAG: hypothetical protein J5679_03030 [Alphaproteobacteria bacterium]|nr:hypothetical protein [Alphaproteobacteria bacterium]
MKKLFLTSLLAVFAASGAQAANVIDGNPLYMPKAGHFYSVTDLSGHTHVEPTDTVTLGEEFGYGITDNFAITVGTSLSESGVDDSFEDYAWNDLSLKATFRAFQDGNIVADIYGGVEAGPNLFAPIGGLYYHSKALDDSWWFDEDLTGYTWLAGLRAGYTTSQFTIAGHIEYGYVNSEMFNWGDQGMRALALGIDGQFVIDSNWNLVAGAEYTGIISDDYAYGDVVYGKVENAGVWNGYFGVNYNIDATKFVGAYINGSLNHQGGDNGDEWEFDDGFGFGMKFGIDF